ncbi:MAG: sensor histidine kinase [Actinobacteria bacterium]|nr:sensor histidine kinase [Actinomycetota bacterium]
MVITEDTAAAPGPPLLARLWPRMADRLAGRGAPDLIDCAIAAGCFAAFTLPVLLAAGPARPLGTEALFGTMAAAPLIVRRRWPVPVVLVVAAVYVAAALADVAFTPFISNAGPNLAIAVFTAADRSRRLWSLTVAGVAGAATWASLPVAIQLHPHHDQDAVQLVAVIVAWLAGDMVRALRGYRQQLQLVQRRRAVEELQLARAEERLRLSREVHDVVSHSLSTIAVQAGVARLVLAEQPGQAGTALSAIETASRSALDELRELLRQIRDPQEADEAAVPTLSELPALIGKLRRAGLDVSYRSTGQPRPYSTAVELSAYRIAQEALTNVTKHASGAWARVEIDHRGSELTLTVTDGGGPDPVRSAASGGLGIPGMRERAELLGGTLTAGPRPDGGFIVTARLPARQGRAGSPVQNGRPGLPDQQSQQELK